MLLWSCLCKYSVVLLKCYSIKKRFLESLGCKGGDMWKVEIVGGDISRVEMDGGDKRW